MLNAINKLYEELNFENPNVLEDYRNDVLTENTARNGRDVIWYMSNEKCVAIYVDTLDILDDDEIEAQLA